MKTESMIIHLERACQREAHVRATADMLPLKTQVMPAVDGQRMTEHQSGDYVRKLRRPTYPFGLQKAEVATFHSHRACWKRIVSQKLDAALILEDDVQLDPDVFPHALELALAHARPGDFIRFPIKMREDVQQGIASAGDIHLQIYDRIGLGMVAQVVTRDAAHKLLAATETFDRPVDTFLQMQWVHGVRILTVWPAGVSEISGELGGSMIHRDGGVVKKIRREILRPLYRRKIGALQKKS